MTSLPDPAQQVMAAKQAAVSQQIGYAIMAKQNDVAKQQGDAVVQLVEQASQLSKAIGAGAKFDGQA